MCTEFTIFFGLLLVLLLIKVYLKLSTGWCRSFTYLGGKTAIVTGANAGLGFYTSLDLAKRGCRVVMACRNVKKANEAREKIIEQTGNKNIVVMLVDMDSLESIRHFAEEFLKNEERLDILVNNAGCIKLGNKTTKDGFDRTTQVNYLAPVLLTHLLLDKLKSSAPSRIVNVSSQSATFTKLTTLDEFNKYPDAFFHGTIAYGNSKLCNIFHTIELAKELEGTGVTINALHPGAVKTEAWNSVESKIVHFFVRIAEFLFYKETIEGSQTQIYLAVAKEVENISGRLFAECKQINLYKTATDKTLSREIWKKTKEMLNIH